MGYTFQNVVDHEFIVLWDKTVFAFQTLFFKNQPTRCVSQEQTP